ncbi:LOG family protein [Candidatus Saccharibacteria bacterium]|nr:LOG family protein [Candidatus Saccharibacteria bacterium]
MSTKYQICVSGSAKGQTVEQGKELASAIGKSLAKAGHSLLTGATSGLPEYAALAYKKAGGAASLGISPAATKVEHVLKYRLPTGCFDLILYTGLHYVGRDALLINSADAVISIGGRLGTLHEFTIAMETHTPIAFLEGAGGISDEIIKLVDTLPNIDPEFVIFEKDPDILVGKLIKLLDKLHKPYHKIYE